ncbi:MAG: cytochrome c [Saprospiraceae bacterium]|nr:cytochrome c [Saprospiraceae bacterium]
MKRILFSMILLGTIALLSQSWDSTAQDPSWVVPESYKNMKNPVAADDASIDIGQGLYNQHCKSCHGKEGLGDGPKAAQLDTPSGDFTSEEFLGQSDGAIFYKTWIGRDEMPNFEKKIPDKEDVWHLVNYMRHLGEM